ncbi:class I SAM-dependent methyltransferase [Adhaeribacter radiodurans]|uniref:Class I SAM-dependent methyltransferase n=1 Tax=Adhaeribacter radiodurans TaxID=2745197 RepID=A0A7L7LFC9_9BACT|nr:class I SAM-dependent methyltransferase [Adhaeribacter radiodurans]QMU31079.1 class I SAM-dependent methyltransferase [Adhaeribacter radiodurans]
MNYERLNRCPICNKDLLKNFLIVKDNSVSKESFVIVQCENCGFKFTNPRPDENSIGKYYQSAEYISHTNKATGITNKAYKLVRTYTIKQKVDLINRFAPKYTLLDYGCGTGNFLEASKKDGWSVQGYEPSSVARTQAEGLLQQTLAADVSALEHIENESFQVITLWHVLEHIHTLNETFKKLTQLTKIGGNIIVAVPNADSHDAQVYKENWAAYDVPRHLYHFNQATMKRFFKKHKLELLEIIPMKFDAYYVSMLSEKYLTGNNEYIKSVLNGFKSNNYASKNANDYSSLIYVGKKN